MGEDHTAPEHGPDRRRVTVAEASEILGITAEAVRTRIKRGKLDSVKDPPDRTGTVYVLLPADQTRPNADLTTEGQDRTGDQTERNELIESLREQVAYLQGVIATRDQELAQRAEEIRRRDLALEREQQLAAMFADRLRELEAPREAPRAPQSEAVSEEPPKWPPEQPRSGVDVPSGARGSPETVAGGPGEAWWGSPAEEAPDHRESPPSSGPADNPPEASGEAYAARESHQAEEHDPNLRVGQESPTPPERRSLWRWIFGGGS